MPAYGYVFLAIGWVLWVLPFVVIKRPRVKAQTLDRRARWGIVLEGAGYSLLWQNRFWERSLDDRRLLLSICLFALASALSWSGARALGRQWRFDASVNQDHELVKSGPYRIVRHPIYASMLCLLIATGLMITPLPIFVLAIVLFLVGTEIRIRVEERLLASSFGDQFTQYQRTTSAYIPFFR